MNIKVAQFSITIPMSVAIIRESSLWANLSGSDLFASMFVCFGIYWALGFLLKLIGELTKNKKISQGK